VRALGRPALRQAWGGHSRRGNLWGPENRGAQWGAGRDCGQARQTALAEPTSRPRRCPRNARPCDRGQQGEGLYGRRPQSPTRQEPRPGGAPRQNGRGPGAWRRAPTRPRRLSACSLWPLRTLKGSAGELGGLQRKAGGQATGDAPGAPGFPGFPQICPSPGDGSCLGLEKQVATFARGGRGRGWGPGTRYLGTGAQSAPAGARAAAPGRGAAWSSARGGRGATRGCSSRAPGPARGSRSSPRRLRPGAGHGWLPARRSSPDAGAGAGGASSAAPLRALRGSVVRGWRAGAAGLSAARPRPLPRTWPELRGPRRRRRRGSCAPAPVPSRSRRRCLCQRQLPAAP
jgi:hypothetical protein